MKPRFILFYEEHSQDGSWRRRAMLPPQPTRAACRRMAFGAGRGELWTRDVRNFRIARVFPDHPKYGSWIEDPPYPCQRTL